MAGTLERPGASQIVTYDINGATPRWLGTLGHVQALHYSYACPGGCDQLTATLQISARERTDALNPGRKVHVVRGGSAIWRGRLDEPQPTSSGWAISAHGSGTYGADYAAVYTGTWGTGTPDIAVNLAIGRGLAWVNPGIGSPANMWVGQPQNSASLQVTDLLNLVCTKGGLTWYVACTPVSNVLSVFPLPTTVTNLLVSNTPVARTLGGDINTIWVGYQPSTGAFATTSVADANSVAVHGTIETYMDLSAANVMTAAAAQAVGNLVLQRYQRASFAGPFTVGPGQLLTTGGSPVDLGAGMPYAPMVCRLVLTDFGYGGEVTPAPIQFLVGGYEFDDDTQTALVTPFQALDTSFTGLLSMVVSTAPVRKVATTSTKSVA